MDQERRQRINIHSQMWRGGGHANLTFFGGRIARADLGVIETWCALGSLSPFRERLMACILRRMNVVSLRTMYFLSTGTKKG